MSSKLSNLSLEILESFVWVGKGILKTAENPYKALRYGPDMHSQIASTISNLIRYNYVKRDAKKKYINLTAKGRKEAQKILLKKITKKKRWDKKWRALIFDIPESKKSYREQIRKNLREIGFYQLQQSVWVYPYDVLKYLYIILPGFREGDWFEYLEINKISSHDKLKEFFLCK